MDTIGKNRSRNQIRGKLLFFLENYITSEEAVSHNVLYYQPLPVTHYQVSFFADNIGLSSYQ